MIKQERGTASDTERILIVFVSDILPSSLSIQMIMHDEMALKKAGFKKGLYTSR